MANIECRDILNSVYTYVRGSYISKLYSTKLKSRSFSENINEDENLKMTKTTDPESETNINSKEIIGSNTETVKESVERMNESDVADKIRMDIDEKFPFALAWDCSNLALLDREYRKIKGYDAQPHFSEYLIEATDEFPLSDRFAFPVTMYISSMVLIDIDERRSDDFYDKYASSISKIMSEMPLEGNSTVEKYPY